MKSKGVVQLEYLWVKFMVYLLQPLPLPWVQALGESIGLLYLKTYRRRRTILLDNLTKAFPDLSENQKWKLAKNIARHFGRIFLDYAKFMGMKKDKILSYVEITGLEHVAEALEKGNGAFIYSGHFGHWELAAQGLAIHGFPQGMVYRPLDNPKLDVWLRKMRTRFGNTLIPKKGAVKGILQHLKENKLVDILLDQKFQGKGSITVPFFNHPAPTAPTVGLILQKIPAAVVPLYSYPQGKGYQVHLSPPIFFENQSPEEITASLIQNLEERVRETPELWFWFHNRWG